MTKKQVGEQQSSLKVKTGIKAGDHCWDAFRNINSRDRRSVETFVNCCRDDSKCLK